MNNVINLMMIIGPTASLYGIPSNKNNAIKLPSVVAKPPGKKLAEPINDVITKIYADFIMDKSISNDFKTK